MSKQIFNIVFNSDIGTGATTNDAFSLIGQERLMCLIMYHFVLQSAIATLTNTAVANIFVDLGCSHTFLAGPSSGNNALSSMYLGSLRATGTGASNYLVSLLARVARAAPFARGSGSRLGRVVRRVGTSGRVCRVVRRDSVFYPVAGSP